MPGYNNRASSDLGGILNTVTVRNVGNSEQLLYAASNKSAVLGINAANTTTGTLPVSVYVSTYDTRYVAQKSITSNVATLIFSSTHQFAVGDEIGVSGVDATFNGAYTIASVPNNQTITFAKTAEDVALNSASGQVVGWTKIYITKDKRITAGENASLIDTHFSLENSDRLYAISGVANSFDMVLSIQEGVN